MWGVTLQPDTTDDKTDVILRKFLVVTRFNVQNAFDRLSETIEWRETYGIDKLLLEDEDDTYSKDLERAFFVLGKDKDQQPVCYTVVQVFKDNDVLHDKYFSDEAKRERFVKWRMLFMEKEVRKLDFSKYGVSTMLHVFDLKNCTGPMKCELSEAFDSVLLKISSYYPCFLTRQILINMPWWLLAILNTVKLFRCKWADDSSLYVGPSKTRKTLEKYGIEHNPTERDDELERWDGATEETLHTETETSKLLRRRVKSTETGYVL